MSGFSPIITTVSPKHTDLVTSLGATHAIDRNLTPSEIKDAVKDITNKPFEVVYDAISDATTQNTAYDILASSGVLVIVLKNEVEESKKTSDKEIVMTYGSPHISEINRVFGVNAYAHITEWFRTGELKVCLQTTPLHLTEWLTLFFP